MKNNLNKLKIAMFLMGEKGLYTINSFISEFGSNLIDCVISSEDKNVIEDFYKDIRQKCIRNNIKFFNRKDNYKINAEYCYAIGWRWLINIPNKKLIVFHDSLLPKYRGFAPLVSSLINKEKYIGVTALFASLEYDRGEIIFQSKRRITYPIKISEAIKLICPCYFELVKKITYYLINKKEFSPYKQNESLATYSLWRDEEDYHIDWSKDADYIKRFIDAVGYPYKGAYSILEGKKVRIFDVKIIDDVKIENRDFGKVIFIVDKKYPVIVCGKKLLMLTDIRDDASGESLIPFNKFRVRFREHLPDSLRRN